MSGKSESHRPGGHPYDSETKLGNKVRRLVTVFAALAVMAMLLLFTGQLHGAAGTTTYNDSVAVFATDSSPPMQELTLRNDRTSLWSGEIAGDVVAIGEVSLVGVLFVLVGVLLLVTLVPRAATLQAGSTYISRRTGYKGVWFGRTSMSFRQHPL